MNEIEKKQTLKDLVTAACDIKQKLVETMGEVTQDTEAMIISLDKALVSKADGYKFVYDEMISQSELWKNRAVNMTNISKSFAEFGQKLKDKMKQAMIEMQTTEIEGQECRWKLQKSTPIVVIEDETKIPSGHKEIVQTISVRKKSILEDLKLGIPVPGARLEENYYAKVYLNTKEIKK